MCTAKVLKVTALDVTDSTFQRDVLERSKSVAIVVDLWAPWCGPCKTLGPIIEKVVDATNGKVELVKINVDDNPQASSAFKVQSIPAVYALKDGKVVDAFIGAQPESAVQAFIDKLVEIKSPADLLVEAGDETSVLQALELEPAHEGAIIKLAAIVIDRGENQKGLELLAKVPETEETLRLGAVARLGIRENGGTIDIESRLTELLETIKDDEEARQEYRDLLEVMADREQSAKFRRAMASRLF